MLAELILTLIENKHCCIVSYAVQYACLLATTTKISKSPICGSSGNLRESSQKDTSTSKVSFRLIDGCRTTFNIRSFLLN